MKERFVDHQFKAESLALISRINSILAEYQAQGFRLSLRQLYYQLVARDMIPNTVRSYKNTGNLVSEARLAGLVDWAMIEDRGRETVGNSHWDTPADILRSAAYSFKIDKWVDQACHVEVMVEKDALSGVLEPVCRELDISITANKGYSSSSTMYEIGKRLTLLADEGKRICVLYLGDHDPSGIDMTRDVTDRLELFSGLSGRRLEVERLALNWDQVQRWSPPENPAKETDSRYEAYRDRFGESSWELDAVEPATLAALVRDAVEARRNSNLWEAAVSLERTWKAELAKLADRY